MGERELDRRSADRDPVPLADRADAHGALDQGGRGGGVVEEGPRVRVCEDPAVHHTADHDRNALLEAQRQKFPQGTLVKERVAPRNEKRIEVAHAGEPREHLNLIHAGTDRPHDALLAQTLQSRQRAPDRILPMVVRIVDVEDVQPIETEPAQARLHRSEHAVGAVVEDDPHTRGASVVGVILAVAGLAVDVGLRTHLVDGDEQAADLGREDEIVAAVVPQGQAQAPLGIAIAIEWGAVEIADAGVPCVPDETDRRDGSVQPADLGGTESQTGDPNTARSQGYAFGWLDDHRVSSNRGRAQSRWCASSVASVGTPRTSQPIRP